MGTLVSVEPADPDANGRRVPALLAVAFVGLGAYAAAAATRTSLLLLAYRFAAPQTAHTIVLAQHDARMLSLPFPLQLIYVLVVIVLFSPVLETAPLAALAYTLREKAFGGRTAALLAITFGLAWLLHGAGWTSLAQAVGFVVLAVACWRWGQAQDYVTAYARAAGAHVIWNLCAIAPWLVEHLA